MGKNMLTLEEWENVVGCCVTINLARGFSKDEILSTYCDIIVTLWDDLELGEQGMSPEEAEEFLDYTTEFMTQYEIDEAVSSVQRDYYAEHEAEEDEIIEKLAIILSEVDSGKKISDELWDELLKFKKY